MSSVNPAPRKKDTDPSARGDDSLASAHVANGNASINDARKVTDGAELPQWQKTLENLEDQVQSSAFKGYSDMAQGISAAVYDATVRDSIEGFAHSSKIMMAMLDDISKIHPFITVAVLAFKAVVTLELKRRDNADKIILLYLQMQEMMSVLLPLSEIPPHERGSKHATPEELLRGLIPKIAKDIREAGNACDTIQKKSLVARVLKSLIYEARLADYATTFDNRRKELQLLLATFTATGIASANNKLSHMKTTLGSTDEKLDMIMLFRMLDSPQEKELMELIKLRGGPKKCMEDNAVLGELMVMRKNQDPAATLVEYSRHQYYSNRPGHGMSHAGNYGPSSAIYHGTTPAMNYGMPPGYGTSPPVSYGMSPGYGTSPAVNYGTSPPVSYGMSPGYGMSPAVNYGSSPPVSYGMSPGYGSSPAVNSGAHAIPSSHTTPYPTSPPNPVPAFSPPDPRFSQSMVLPHSSAAVPMETRDARTSYYDGNASTGHQGAYLPNSYSTPVYMAAGVATAGPSPTIDVLILSLRDQLQEDVDDSFNKNMVIFQRKLDVQKKQLLDEFKPVIRREGDRVIEAIGSGPHDRIIHSDLHTVWRDMAWKRNVKARNFVLSLHEYYIERYRDTDPRILGANLNQQYNTIAKPENDDRWALAYINIINVQPILEAFDDDGSGFVSVFEANEFTASRPPGWSLLHWLAYWAVGWHLSVLEYRSKIISILEQMSHIEDIIIPWNKRAFTAYLENSAIERLKMLLCGVRESPPDARIMQKISSYVQSEEARVEANLSSVNYELDGPDTLRLVTGPGRIERYVFPLLYLLLRHHLRIAKLACNHCLSPAEWDPLVQSLSQILDAIVTRIGTIAAVCTQKNLSLTDQLQSFAFGMLQFVNDPFPRAHIPLSKMYLKEDLSPDETDTGLLKFGVQTVGQAVRAAYALPDYEASLEDLDTSDPTRKVIWCGWRFDNTSLGARSLEEETGLIQIKLSPATSAGDVEGVGIDNTGTFSIRGHLGGNQLEGIFMYENAIPSRGRNLNIRMDAHGDECTMYGSWSSQINKGTIYLKRTLPSVMRFQPIPASYNDNPARARWSFALSAVQYQIRRKLRPYTFFRNKLYERQRFVLLCKHLENGEPLLGLEQGELSYYMRYLGARDLGFYILLARFELKGVREHTNSMHICDSCHRTIFCNRNICVDCPGHPDLCSTCLYYNANTRLRPPGSLSLSSYYGLTSHNIAHSVVRTKKPLDDSERANLITEVLEARTRRHNPDSTSILGIQCIGDDCRNTNIAWHWYCLSCDIDVFLCNDCDTKEFDAQALAFQSTPFSKISGHKLEHFVIRRDALAVATQSIDPARLPTRDPPSTSDPKVNQFPFAPSRATSAPWTAPATWTSPTSWAIPPSWAAWNTAPPWTAVPPWTVNPSQITSPALTAATPVNTFPPWIAVPPQTASPPPTAVPPWISASPRTASLPPIAVSPPITALSPSTRSENSSRDNVRSARSERENGPKLTLEEKLTKEMEDRFSRMEFNLRILFVSVVLVVISSWLVR